MTILYLANEESLANKLSFSEVLGNLRNSDTGRGESCLVVGFTKGGGACPCGLWEINRYFVHEGHNLVLLKSEVAKAFPSEQAVNEALLSLIEVAQNTAGQTK